MTKPLSREKLLEYLDKHECDYAPPGIFYNGAMVSLINEVKAGKFDEDAPAFDVESYLERLKERMLCLPDYGYDRYSDGVLDSFMQEFAHIYYKFTGKKHFFCGVCKKPMKENADRSFSCNCDCESKLKKGA